MKRSFLLGLVMVFAFGILGCGGGGSSGPGKVVKIEFLNNGYAVRYLEALNIEGEIQFCSEEYNITGSIESNGTFLIDDNKTIIFVDFVDDNGLDDFYLNTAGPTPGELEQYKEYDINGSLERSIKITNIAEINCTG